MSGSPNPKQILLSIKPKSLADTPQKTDDTVKPKIKKLPDIIKPVLKKLEPETKEVEPDIKEAEPKNPQESVEQVPTIFQAVGIISGDIRFDDNGKSFVSLGGNEYPLYYVPSRHKRKAYNALIKEIAASGNHQKLIVYPRILHFPKREQIHAVSFQLVGFDKGRTEESLANDLQDLEFKLCGLWQFIPVCQTPCITVLRNFTSERLDYIKKEETSVLSKVKFMKASHVPVIWRDAPVRPFRFNPKVPKESQGHASFVEIKAKFLPGKNVFGFDSLLSLPTDKPPRFFKARKEDKAEAIRLIREIRAKM